MTPEDFMEIALKEAQKAAEMGEVPVGALIVSPEGEILSKAHNLKESSQDPCGHAEILAIQKAAKVLNSWRLSNCSLYVTLEPCMMCTGALVHARLGHIYFGAHDPKSGYISSVVSGLDLPHNHAPSWTGGVLELKCSSILKDFFKKRR